MVIKCPACQNYTLDIAAHICPPLWHVRIAPTDENYDGDDTPTLIYAHEARAAAQAFCERWDTENAYSLASSQAIIVLVSLAIDPGTVQPFKIYGEWAIIYHAVQISLVEPEENPAND